VLKIGESEINAVARVIRRGRLFRYGDPKDGHLNECARFERELARKVGTEHALVVTSGTAALICGLVGMGIGPGDEVIIPGYTFVSTALAPLAVGAIPVIAEIDESLTIDPKDVEKKVSSRTKAIIPVHMVGHPANLSAIMRLAKARGTKVLEDACQADGGLYRGKRLGAIGHAGAFSFNYFKNIVSGEGGALVTDDEVLFERALIHHDSGCLFRPHAGEIGVPFFAGTNFRMTEILAAVLRVQLRRIDGLLTRMRAHKAHLMERLGDHPGIRFIKHHGLEGECASALGFRFRDEATARAFVKGAQGNGVHTWIPLDSGRHVYSNWEVVMKRRGSYHPALDAYRRPENQDAQMDYSPDMCPRTLDILARTVWLDIRPQMTKKDLGHRVRACRAAADTIRK
jgi:dTDP-4-amino-4,6-dideoxygalactose transaminase